MLLLLLLLGITTFGVALPRGTPWAEIPTDRALLIARKGTVEAVHDGRPQQVHPGQRVTVRRGDRIAVPVGATGLLVFRGGAQATLCPAAQLDLLAAASRGQRPIIPRADIGLVRGAMVVSTSAETAAFGPLRLPHIEESADLVHDARATQTLAVSASSCSQ